MLDWRENVRSTCPSLLNKENISRLKLLETLKRQSVIKSHI